MDSEYNVLELTDAQRLVDSLLLESVQEDFVRPLVDELRTSIPGFDEMSYWERELAALKLNEPLFGKGDFLQVRGKLFYAGRKLGQDEVMTWGDVTVVQYQPRFSGPAPTKLHFDLETGEVKSDLELLFTEERELFDSLPAPYRLALLYTYVESKVIANSDEIMRFVLGWSLDTGELLETRRFSAEPAFGNTNVHRGWTVRIRDGKPGTKFSEALGRFLRGQSARHDDSRLADYDPEVDRREAHWQESWAVISFEDGHRGKPVRKPRETDPKVEYACRYIYALERKGAVIDGRKKGGIGFAQILADLQRDHADKIHHYEDPDSLRKVYMNWKKRLGLS